MDLYQFSVAVLFAIPFLYFVFKWVNLCSQSSSLITAPSWALHKLGFAPRFPTLR